MNTEVRVFLPISTSLKSGLKEFIPSYPYNGIFGSYYASNKGRWIFLICMHFFSNRVNKTEVKFLKLKGLNVFASSQFACCWCMYPKYTYLLTLENCRWKALFPPFLSLIDAAVFGWAACGLVLKLGYAGLSLTLPAYRTNFCLTCHSRDEEDVADSLSSPISIAVNWEIPPSKSSCASRSCINKPLSKTALCSMQVEGKLNGRRAWHCSSLSGKRKVKNG